MLSLLTVISKQVLEYPNKKRIENVDWPTLLKEHIREETVDYIDTSGKNNYDNDNKLPAKTTAYIQSVPSMLREIRLSK